MKLEVEKVAGHLLRLGICLIFFRGSSNEKNIKSNIKSNEFNRNLWYIYIYTVDRILDGILGYWSNLRFWILIWWVWKWGRPTPKRTNFRNGRINMCRSFSDTPLSNMQQHQDLTCFFLVVQTVNVEFFLWSSSSSIQQRGQPHVLHWHYWNMMVIVAGKLPFIDDFHWFSHLYQCAMKLS